MNSITPAIDAASACLQDKMQQIQDNQNLLYKAEKREKDLKEKTKRNRMTFSLFGGEFPCFRRPMKIAQEIFSGLYEPRKVSITHTLKLIRELEKSLAESQRNEDPVPPEMETSFAVAAGTMAGWYERIDKASNTEKGIERLEFFKLVTEMVPDGTLLDRMTEIMDQMKLNRGQLGKEIIYQSQHKPKNQGSRAAGGAGGGGPSTSGTQKKEVKTNFKFETYTEYKKSGTWSVIPCFPRPSNCPAGHKYWCPRCGYSSHTLDNCWSEHPELEPKDRKRRLKRSRSRSPERKLRRDKR